MWKEKVELKVSKKIISLKDLIMNESTSDKST